MLDSTDSWREQGYELLVRAPSEDAARCFRKALRYSPDDSLSWTGLGLALFEIGKYEGAVKSFDKALKQSGSLIDNWLFRADALVALGRFQEAVESYERAVKDGLSDAEVRPRWMESLRRLEKYVRERVPKPHLDAYELLAFIEERLHFFIRQRLRQVFGEEDTQWWVRCVPLNIRKDCAQRREEDPRRKHEYNYIYLIDLSEILKKNWKLFEPDFERIKGQAKTKKEFLGSLVRLNEIRKEVMHPVRGNVTEADLEFARQMRDMIESFTPLG